MNYNFYANRSDKLEILDFIFNETDLIVYDLGSGFGQQICEYKTIEEISSKFDLDNGDKFEVCFQLWSPKFLGKVLFRKIELNPKHCNGQTFRYSTDGWGLIQLYFGGLKNNELNNSHIGHFSVKGALKWEANNLANGKVKDWDWIEIQTISNKIRDHIDKNLSVRKIASFRVLNGADKIIGEGIKFR